MSKKCREKTEVYSRVVGYFRPIQQWNKGKRQEFNDRKTFKVKGDDKQMICYKDRTFCKFLECTNKECDRRLVDEVREAASQWWVSFLSEDDPPIAVFTNKPVCYTEEGK